MSISPSGLRKVSAFPTHQQSWRNIKCDVVIVSLGHEDWLSWPIKHEQEVLRLCWS